VSAHYGIFCDRGSAWAPGAAPVDPNTILDNLVIGPAYEAGVVATASTAPIASGCNLSLTSSTILENEHGMRAYGCMNTPNVPVAVRVGGDTAEMGVKFDSLRRALNGTGISFYECISRGDVRNSSFSNSDSGILVQAALNGSAPSLFTFIGDKFDRLDNFGLAIIGGAPRVDRLENNAFTGISNVTVGNAFLGAGLLVKGDDQASFPLIEHARGNRFIGNDVGLVVQGGPTLSQSFGDFGTVSDPGNNIFRCNSTPGIVPAKFVGGDVVIESDVVGQVTFPFRGNSWDHDTPTVAGPSNRTNGVDLAILSGLNPPTVDTGQAMRSSENCPAGQTP
jgi:hypothetical protein